MMPVNDKIAALVTAAKAIMLCAPPGVCLTMISVFCSVRMETSASIRLMMRSSTTSTFELFRHARRRTWMKAIVSLSNVYAAMAMAGISPMLTGFCMRTIRDTGAMSETSSTSSSAPLTRKVLRRRTTR